MKCNTAVSVPRYFVDHENMDEEEETIASGVPQ